MKTVIACSGGVDSTYALWKHALNTQDEITVLFLKRPDNAIAQYDSFGNAAITNNNGVDSLAKRVQTIVDWVGHNVRPVELLFIPFEKEIAKLNRHPRYGPDGYVTDWAISKINAGEFDCFLNSSEFENDGNSYGPDANGVTPDKATRELATFKIRATRGCIKFPLLDGEYTQAKAMREMPTELFDLTFSCDVGEHTACGTCFKCAKRNFLRKYADLNWSNKEIFDFVKRQSTLSDGSWWPMKKWIQLYEEYCVQKVDKKHTYFRFTDVEDYSKD
jgi:hypothetical protein